MIILVIYVENYVEQCVMFNDVQAILIRKIVNMTLLSLVNTT